MNNKTNLWIESNLITRQVNHVNDASSKAPSVLLLKFPVQKFQQIRLKKSTFNSHDSHDKGIITGA